MRDLEGGFERLGYGLELAETVFLCNTSFKNQGFRLYASTPPFECFLDAFEIVFGPS